MDTSDLEPLMVMVMNHFADRMANHAIVKGGMELRLVDCPRFTNDLDYIFIPYSSKKELQGQVLQVLREIPGVTVASSINSKCLRFIVQFENKKLQIEINVALECPSVELSTASIANVNKQQGRIVRAMRFDHALAHKFAAWNERGLMRDIYDIWFLAERIGTKPDMNVLKKRLSVAEVRVSGRTSKISMTLPDFCKKMDAFIETITQKGIEGELRDYLSADEMAGLEFKFKATLKKALDFFSGF